MAIFNPTRPVTVIDTATGQSRFFEIGAGRAERPQPGGARRADSGRRAGEPHAWQRDGNAHAPPEPHGADDARRRLHDVPFGRRTCRAPTPVGAQFNGLARQAERSLQNLNFQQLLTCDAAVSATRQELELVGGYEYSRVRQRGLRGRGPQSFITDAFQLEQPGRRRAGERAATGFVQRRRASWSRSSRARTTASRTSTS